MKQKNDRTKSFLSRFTRSSLAICLALLLVFGTMATSFAVVIEHADLAANLDVAESGTTVPSGKTFYLDVTNFSATYDSGYYMSLSGNGTKIANKSDTTGAGSYLPKNDNSWVQMTQVSGNIYKGTTTAQNTNGRISFWSKNESGYNNVWEVNVSLGNAYNSSYDLFTISSGYTTHDSRHACCFSGTWSKYSTTTPLSTPTITLGGQSSSLSMAAGTSTTLSITNFSSKFSDAATTSLYTLNLYKEGSSTAVVSNITTANTTVTLNEGGKYYVKCEPTSSGSASYSASESSKITVTVTKTFYVCNSDSWTNVYYYLYTGNTGHTSWPGTQLTSSMKIGELDGNPVYKVTGAPDNDYIILNNNSDKQYKDGISFTNGTLYYTVSTNKPVTIGRRDNFDENSLDKPKHNVTFTPSPTGGTVKVNDSSTSPVAVAEGGSYSVKVTPKTGYKISSLIVGGTTVTDAANQTSAYTYNGTMGTADVNVTASFAKRTFTVTLNKNATDATAGTDSVTATYGNAMPTATMPTRTGYTFAGYYDTSAATGGNMYYKADGTSNKSWNKTSNTTLYARWTENTGTAVVKAYTGTTAGTTGGKVKQGSGTATSSVTLSAIGITTSNSVTAVPTDTTYTFSGWQFFGTKYDSLRYNFDGSDTWLTPTSATLGTSSDKTIYIKTNGDTGINAEVHAIFEQTDFTGLTVGAAYTSNNSTYTDFTPTPSGVTIGATHGTYQTGVSVSAPAKDPDGYQFYQWYTANGTFANASNKDTTFKPNANGAKAIARYKKIFTITSSVDSTGKGKGTVMTSVTEVEAGGSYTITATPATGSAVESIKIGGTQVATSSPYTKTGVNADQVVTVKFASQPHVIGDSGLCTGSWSVPGDEMTSNSDGSEFTVTFTEVAAGTYTFQHYLGIGSGGTYDNSSTDIATKTMYTGVTLSAVGNGYGGKKFQLVLPQKSDVTLVSNGTKLTAITVRKSGGAKFNVTFTKVANTTITGSYLGTPFTTESANAVVEVFDGDSISFTVTPASGYHISTLTGATFTPAFSTTEDDYKITNVTADKTVTPAAAADVNVTAKTNKSSRGTVTVDKDKSFINDTVKITISPKNGVLKTLSATYATGEIYDCTVTNGAASNTWTLRSASSGASLQSIRMNKELAESGANMALAESGADQTVNMVMQKDSAVTINATFDAYSAESNWYYNGYQSATDPKAAYWGKQMTEGVIGGEKFSYYHVTGRGSENYNQYFTVSDGLVSTGTRYVYFTQLKSGGWDFSHSPYAYFMGASNSWPGTQMTWYTDNDMGQPVYRIAIPSGATGVVFNDGNTHKSTDINDLASGGYYVDEYSTWDGNNSVHTGHTYNCSYPDAGTSSSGNEYKWGSNVYKDNFYTGGFYDQGSNVAKPKDNNGTNFSTCKDDYYIVVLYPGTKYTFDYNGHTTTNTVDSDKPWVVWMSELPGGDDENVTIYAKDGSIRSESYGSTYANIANTKIYAADGTTAVGTNHNGNITNQTWETYKASKGDTIVIKTQIGATESGTLSDAADLKEKYYVRGFCVNGEVSELLEWKSDGLYTLTYKVPEDTEITKFEITPIYYLKDTTANPIVTYRVTGFTDELKQIGAGKPNWGDTLYTYPFYGKLGSQNNALGAYPGQPMVYYKGQYQMQIPQKSTAWDIYYDDGALSGYTGNSAKANAVHNMNVSGVTMSNGYYDIVHRQVMGYGNNGASADHVQTYDYGDFFKIFNEKKPVDNIVFDFKYRTKKHNFENQPGATITKANLDTNYGTNGNGLELLTNFHGRVVDLFGTPLSGDAADPSKTTPVYVVSIGGVNGSKGVENIAGYYATEWMVYGSSNGSSYTRITVGDKVSIPPEVLVLKDDDATSFSTSTYPSADANHSVTDWKALYTALEAYRGKPVMISYEAADAQIGAGNYATSGGGGATRNDGRWLYSNNGENITSTIRIDVSHDSGANYIENPASGETGHVENLSAYFTNADAYQEMTYSTTIDPDKTFDMEAKTTNSSYKFVGWYMADGTKITSDNVTHTERSGSYTFVARFMEVTSGQLTLSHSVDTGEAVNFQGADYICDGSGTAKIGAVITDAETNEVLRTFELGTSDITIPERYIGSDKNYNITVTLEATADTNTAYGTSKLSNTDASSVTESRFFNPKTPATSGKTTTYTFTFNVMNDLYNGTIQRTLALTYHSYFIQYKFNYAINYTFDDRDGNTKQYKRIGTLTPGEANTYVKKIDSSRYLDKSFIEKMAPYESNFGQDITWNFSDYLISTGGEDGSNFEYAINAHYTAVQNDTDLKRNVTFKLPYEHTNGIATGGNAGTAATTTDFALTGNNAVTFDTVPVLPSNGVNGIYTDDTWKNWIAAPATINDNGTVKNFLYWSVKPTDRSEATDPDVARCYFQGFNFVILDNYVIEAVYGDSPLDSTNGTDRRTDITFIETTRNQWNTNGETYNYKTQRDKAADLLYNDFIVSYAYDGKEIYSGEVDDDIADLGIVVERVQKLYENQDGTLDTTLSRYTSIAQNTDTVNSVINGSTVNKFSIHSLKNTSGEGTEYKALDNKDRILLYNAFYNSAGWTKNTTGGVPGYEYAYKNYVYRAYSYIKDSQGNIILSEPSYFTMYDVASASYQAPNAD